MGQLVFFYILCETTKYYTMKLIQEIEQQRQELLDEIAHIRELGFDPEKVLISVDIILREQQYRNGADGESAGKAHAGEREWRGGIEQQAAQQREPAKFTIKPEQATGVMVGDKVLYNRKIYNVAKWDAGRKAWLVGANETPVTQDQLEGPKLIDLQGKKARVWMMRK